MPRPSLHRRSATSLLGRGPLPIGVPEASTIAGRRVLVTGAGGFIGAALCRRLAALDPEHLVLLDGAEGGLQRLERALSARGRARRIALVLGSAADRGLLDETFAVHRPEIVFHTAAFKHLPLLERQAVAAVGNNVLATHALLEAAERVQARDFVLLSTDKAVDPTSVMGASKRIAELLVLARRVPFPRARSLRLGNVLGSSGSLLPLLRRQARRNEAFTLTHPEARRYFLTASEAVTLLLHAAASSGCGEVLVPDLGPPVRIVDLARRVAEGPIVFTGLRPGEKLEEALWSAGERPVETQVPLLLRVEGPQPSAEEAEAWVSELAAIVSRRDVAALLGAMREIVPAYRPSAAAWEAARAVEARGR
jgi:FlaA1/EpsC-like NDP-sugar epimerase